MFRHGSSIEQPAQESPTIYRGELSKQKYEPDLVEEIANRFFVVYKRATTEAPFMAIQKTIFN